MLSEKRSHLFAAAKTYAQSPTDETGRGLCAAASAYAEARIAAAAATTARTPPAADGHVIPFGKSKGMPLSAVDDRDLQWTMGALARSIEDPEKARWRDANEALHDAIAAELVRRRR